MARLDYPEQEEHLQKEELYFLKKRQHLRKEKEQLRELLIIKTRILKNKEEQVNINNQGIYISNN
jgi:hypothetical protein